MGTSNKGDTFSNIQNSTIINKALLLQISQDEVDKVIIALQNPQQNQNVISDLEQKIAANEAQMKFMLAASGLHNVPPEQAADRLFTEILKLRDIKIGAQPLPNDDSRVADIKTSARDAIEEGRIDHAAMLLDIADGQTKAVELISQHKAEQALDLLHAIDPILGKILAENPNDLKLKAQQGYLHKTYAQAYTELGDSEKSDKFLESAGKVFYEISTKTPAYQKTVADLANAINGEGNILHARGLFREAISKYKLAVELVPTYAYAWHDLFGAYIELAKKGDIHFDDMQYAMDRLKQCAKGWPSLDETYIAKLELYLDNFRDHRGRSGPRSPTDFGSFTIAHTEALTPQLEAKLNRKLREYIAYLHGLGLTREQAEVIVRVAEAGDIYGSSFNAYYEKETKTIVADQRIASDPDVIRLTYTFHVLEDGEDSSPTHGRIRFGLSNYLCGSFAGRAKIGELAGAAMAPRLPYLRNLDNHLTFHAGKADVFQWGEIWGGAFWEIRKQFGQAMADRILARAWLAPSRQVLSEASSFVGLILSATSEVGAPTDVAKVRSILSSRSFPLPVA